MQQKGTDDMASTTIRISTDLHEQTRRMAALRGETPGELLAQAWDEYLANHREDFALELEQAAELVRNGTRDDLVRFVNRNNREKAERASARLRQKATG